MRKVILFFALLVLSYGLTAQISGQVAQYSSNVGITDALYNHAMGSISDKLKKIDYSDDTIEGTPYMSNTFSLATIYYGDEIVGDLYYRYNAYNEEVEIKDQNIDGAPIKGLGKDKKIKLMVNGKPMSFKTFIDKKGNTKNGYLTLLTDGELKLYKHLKVTFKEAKKAENSLVKGNPAKFSQATRYYIESADGNRINYVELNNKKVLNLLSNDKKKVLSDYLKENKLKIKNEQDLIQVVTFLNN
jgi:hypothetical protein